MSGRGADQISVTSRGLLNCVSKGSLVTWRLQGGSDGDVELGDINVSGAVGAKAGVIAAHPSRLHVYVAGVADSDKEPGDIFLFGLANAQCLQRLSGHARKVTHLVWAQGAGLVSGSEDGTCRLWNAAGQGYQIYDTGRTKTFLGNTDPEKVAALVTDDAGRLFVGNEGGGIDIVQLRRPHTVEPLLNIWRERRLEDVPQAALDAYTSRAKRSQDRIDRKKKAGTLGDTTSEEEKQYRKELEKAEDVDIEPSNKRPLAARAGDQDNAIHSMVLLDGGESVAATTTGGEVLVARKGDHESLVVFRKSYAGCLQAGQSDGERRLYVGNRGYDAKVYEVVVLGVGPLRQLKRVSSVREDSNMIVGLHWCRAANKLLVAYDEAGLYALDPDCSGKAQTLFDSKEEDKDSMSNESVLGFTEHEGRVFVRTSWSRLRCFRGNDLQEVEPLRPVGQAGVVGRVQMGVDRQSGTIWSIRGGYDKYKVDMAKPGDETWKRLTNLPFANGWPPAFLRYLEWHEAPTPEQRGMVLLGGELGGLCQVKEGQGEEPPTLLSFKDFPAGNVAYHATMACATWDSQGALVVVRAGSSKTHVFDWTERSALGRLEGKQPSMLTRIAVKDGRSFKPWVAVWDNAALTILDARALSLVRRFTLAEYPRPWCLYCADDGRVFTYCSVDQKSAAGSLAVWRLQMPLGPTDAEPLLGGESGDAVAAKPELEAAEAEVEAITSMLLISGVGLLTAHRKVKDGISIWCPRSGLRLCRLHPAQAGTSLHIWLGPGSGTVLWSAAGGGRTGYLRWNSLYMIGQTTVEDGEPRFSSMRYVGFLLDVWSILVNIGQIASFALYPPWAEEAESGIDSSVVDIRLPEIFDAEVVQDASSFLTKLQGISIPHVPWVYEFYGSIVFIAMFAALLIGQELIEERAFLYPGSCWREIFKLANKLAKTIVQSCALPLLTYLISGFVCRGSGMSKLEDVVCLSRHHLAYFIAPGLLAALALHVLCFRFARVGFELSNLDVGANLLDVTTDYVPENQEPEHLVSSMSPAYQNTNLLGKVGLKVVKTLAPIIKQQGVRLQLMTGLNAFVGGAVSCSSLFTNPFAMRPQGCLFQPCALQFAQDAANAWIFFCVFLAAAVAGGILPDGGWLDVAGYVVLAVFPLGFFLRIFMPSLQARWRSRRTCSSNGGYTSLSSRGET